MTITAETRKEPKATLQNMEVHSGWTKSFRTTENDVFYQLAFDSLAAEYGAPDEHAVVDAGCGSAVKTLQLARRGYRVLGLDFSAPILEQARAAVKQEDLTHRVEFAQADLTALQLSSGSAKRVLCWGVLMHIPDVEKAIAELARIVGKGGVLIISEGNVRSVQARSIRWLKRLLGRERAEVIRAPAGIEFWEETSTGRLMTRQADIPWMITAFERHGLKLKRRYAGQFSEVYTVLPWAPARKLVHAFNNFWFRHIAAPGMAFANILVFIAEHH